MSNIFFTIPLRDLVVTQKGIKPIILKENQFEGAVPYLDISVLETGQVKEYTFKELGNIATPNDVLVVWDGSRSGLVLKGAHGVIGSTIMKLTPIGITSEYLYYFIKSKYDFINGNVTGAGIPHVNTGIFFDLAIPYVSIENQEKIVNDLTKRIQTNDFLIKKQKEIIQKTLSDIESPFQEDEDVFITVADFKNSILHKAITGKLTETWRKKNEVSFSNEYTPLGSIIRNIKSGKSFRCLERPPGDDEIGVLKISAISSSEYREEESKTCIDKSKINPDLFVKTGDFLMTRANTRELVGACVIVKDVEKKIMLSDKILRIEFDAEKIVDEFLILFLRSKEGREQIENLATGSQESMKNITQSDINNILLIIPDIKEQIEIIKQANKLMIIADRIKEKYENTIDTFNKLEKSILEEAFDKKSILPYQSDISVEKVIEDILIEKAGVVEQVILLNKMNSKAKSNMKKSVTEISPLDIEDILSQNEGAMPAKEVWKASKYSKNIDEFYEAVKHKVSVTINCNVIKKDEVVPESILSLKSNKL